MSSAKVKMNCGARTLCSYQKSTERNCLEAANEAACRAARVPPTAWRRGPNRQRHGAKRRRLTSTRKATLWWIRMVFERSTMESSGGASAGWRSARGSRSAGDTARGTRTICEAGPRSHDPTARWSVRIRPGTRKRRPIAMTGGLLDVSIPMKQKLLICWVSKITSLFYGIL